MLIIRAREIDELLPMQDCIEAMGRAMRSVSSGAMNLPERTIMPMEGDNYFFLMPGAAADSPVYGAKIVSLHPDNPAQGRPTVQGFVTLFDRNTGEALAILEGARLTALRTAAASALATRELAREDSTTLGLFGNGALAASHLEAISCVRNIEEVVVWGRNPANAAKFAREQSALHGLPVSSTVNAAKAAACDIICLVTNATKPVFKAAWLGQGCHLNLVGAHRPNHREVDSGTVSRAAIYVDTRDGAMREAGDILIPMAEGCLGHEPITGEIGEVLNGTIAGRKSTAQVTLYKSLGTVAQDLFAAEEVFRAACSAGLGEKVDFP